MKSIPDPKGILGFLSLTSLGAATFLPDTYYQLDRRDGQAWPYGVIGDSWGSGVSYNDDVLYDGNKDNCLRTSESHGPQMEADNTWIGHDPSGLRDAACSGSILGDIVEGQHQMGKVGNPDVVIMTSGGNNAGFGNIVDVCIYHSDQAHNYGNPYVNDPDRSGDCAKALDAALEYITDKMQIDLTNTLDDLFNDPAVSGDSDFLLYLTGYAQFFGTDYDPWCDWADWSVPTFNQFNYVPYLSKNLRQDFNDHVSKVNSLYQTTAESDKYKAKVRYIDVDSGFAGHRFCEPGSNYNDQVNTDTHFDGVYLWNLNYPWQVTGQGAPSPQAAQGNVTAQEAQDAFNGQPVTAWNSGSGGGGGNEPGNGWRLRPFHPRYTGYTAIKDAIFAQLKIDGRPEQNPTSTTDPTPTGATAPAPSCSHVDNGTQCQCTDGSTPAPDEDNRCCLYNQPNGNDQCFD